MPFLLNQYVLLVKGLLHVTWDCMSMLADTADDASNSHDRHLCAVLWPADQQPYVCTTLKLDEHSLKDACKG